MSNLRNLLSGRCYYAAGAAAAGSWCWYSASTSSEEAGAQTHLLFPSSSADNQLVSHNLLKVHPASTTQMEASSSFNNKLIFLGTGSSTGCPRPLCPLLFAPSEPDEKPDAALAKLQTVMAPYCRTSNLAVEGGNPAKNKDYRNNPSFLIATETGNVIIDVGKTFREGALRWLPQHQIRSIDAIVLTHQHMDAAGGLDDVRGFQKYVPNVPDDTISDDARSTTSTTKKKGKAEKERFHLKFKQVPMPLFLSQECLEDLQDEFPWLLPKPNKSTETKDGTPFVSRHVASFDVTVFDDSFQPIYPLPGLKITPLPVMHGEDLVSFGFAFTVGGTYNVVYLSDISRMLPETLEFIMTKLPQPTHLLILDALLVDRTNPVHFNLRQAMALVEQIRPQQTFLVGMNCDSFEPHDAMNQRLRKDYPKHDVQLAHDGLAIHVPNNR